MAGPNFSPNVTISIFKDRSSVDWSTATPDLTDQAAQQLPSWLAYNDDQATFKGQDDLFLRRFYVEPGAGLMRNNEPPQTFSDFFRIESPPYPCYWVLDVDNRYDSEGNFVCQYVVAKLQLSVSVPP